MNQFFRYTLCSFIALLVDFLSFSLLINFRFISPELSAALSYMSGLFIAYVLLKLFVFNFNTSHSLKTERVLFLFSGLIGTVTTFLITKVSIVFFVNPFIAKGNAVIFSFFIVFIFRKLYVFRKT